MLQSRMRKYILQLENFYFLGYEKKCSSLKVKQHLGERCLYYRGLRVSQARNQRQDGGMFLQNISWFSDTTRRYIPKDRTLYKHGCENHKSYILQLEPLCASLTAEAWHVLKMRAVGSNVLRIWRGGLSRGY
jgi:hypothetical protein